jgi:hypothetical protein
MTTPIAPNTGRSEMATAAPRKRAPRAPKPTAGARLLEALSRPGEPYSIGCMVEESARIADRLERLDALLSGEKSAWMQVKLGRDGTAEIKVDNALQEARSQATALRGLLAEIWRQRAKVPLLESEDDDLDDLI